ncbi:MAG: hypothetical protein Tsb002_30070 [Wenzhouxiangellaceae bacterium]
MLTSVARFQLQLITVVLIGLLMQASAWPQGCPAPSFTRMPNVPIAGNTSARVVAGSFNNDLNIDLATADRGADAITIVLGDGAGNFIPAPGSPIAMPASPGTNGSRPSGLVVADFDRDGDNDIVASLENSNQIILLRGSSNGAFVADPPININGAAEDIALGDFNFDGLFDIATSNSSNTNASMSIMLGNGAGGFSHAPGSPVSFGVPASTMDIVAGQFVGNGAVDLAITNSSNDTVLIFEGQGNGSFVFDDFALVGTDASSSPLDIKTANINGDGFTDLLVANRVIRPTGSTPGSPDNSVTVLLGSNTGFILDQEVFMGFDTGAVVGADFNLDGSQDIAVANAAFSFAASVRLNDGNGQFPSPAVSFAANGNPFDVIAPDLNRDGSSDLVVLNQSAELTIYLNDCISAPPIASNDQGTGFTTDEDSAFITADVRLNDNDPNNDPLTVTGFDASATVGLVTAAGNGQFNYDPAGLFETLNVGDQATDTFSYTVSDNAQGSDTAMVTITINGVNDAPQAQGQNFTLIEDMSLSIAAPGLLTTAMDVDNINLTTVLVNPPANATSFTLNGDGSFDYTPIANFNGLDSFDYQVSDGDLLSAVVTAVITVSTTNDAPLAMADSYMVNEDQPLNIAAPGVLGNDTDIDNDPLTVALITSPAAAQQFNLNSDGSFNYLPQTNFNGQDSFTYQVSDGLLTSAPATVVIDVTAVNDDPLALDDQGGGFITDELTPFITVSVLQNDSDIDGDLLSVGNLDSSQTIGLVSDNGDGTFTYDPNGQFDALDNGELALDRFNYTVVDGNGGQATAQVEIQISGLGSMIDLILTSDAVEPVQLGSRYRYRLQLSNAGPGNSDDLSVRMNLPSVLSFIGSSCSTLQGDTVVWDVGPLSAGVMEQCEFEVEVALQATGFIVTQADAFAANAGTPLLVATTDLAVRGQVLAVPALSNAARTLLMILLMIMGGLALRYRTGHSY